MLERDGWICSYCLIALEGSNATVDHIIAKANGGTDDESNLVSCCRPCNARKGAKVILRSAWFNAAWLTGLP